MFSASALCPALPCYGEHKVTHITPRLRKLPFGWASRTEIFLKPHSNEAQTCGPEFQGQGSESELWWLAYQERFCINVGLSRVFSDV